MALPVNARLQATIVRVILVKSYIKQYNSISCAFSQKMVNFAENFKCLKYSTAAKKLL
jgi:hypothetical protein